MAKEEKKKRRPTALKRDIQNAKKNLKNRMFKSRVHTSVRSLDEAIKSGDSDATKSQLSRLFSFMDKGVKRGIFKKNKAARVKSSYSAKVASIK